MGPKLAALLFQVDRWRLRPVKIASATIGTSGRGVCGGRVNGSLGRLLRRTTQDTGSRGGWKRDRSRKQSGALCGRRLGPEIKSNSGPFRVHSDGIAILRLKGSLLNLFVAIGPRRSGFGAGERAVSRMKVVGKRGVVVVVVRMGRMVMTVAAAASVVRLVQAFSSPSGAGDGGHGQSGSRPGIVFAAASPRVALAIDDEIWHRWSTTPADENDGDRRWRQACCTFFSTPDDGLQLRGVVQINLVGGEGKRRAEGEKGE